MLTLTEKFIVPKQGGVLVAGCDLLNNNLYKNKLGSVVRSDKSVNVLTLSCLEISIWTYDTVEINLNI